VLILQQSGHSFGSKQKHAGILYTTESEIYFRLLKWHNLLF